MKNNKDLKPRHIRDVMIDGLEELKQAWILLSKSNDVDESRALELRVNIERLTKLIKELESIK